MITTLKNIQKNKGRELFSDNLSYSKETINKQTNALYLT